MPTAEGVARYLLHLAAGAEEPAYITQVQLHKLLYYAQGWWLATHDEPLFPARFQAWIHGPVEAGLYPKFADYESRPIAPHEALEDPALTKEHRAVVESVWLGYGKFSAWHLREKTHKEAPWKDARRSLPNDAISRAPITDAAIKRFFEGLHEASCRRHGTTAKELAESIAQARRGETTEFVLPTRRT